MRLYLILIVMCTQSLKAQIFDEKSIIVKAYVVAEGTAQFPIKGDHNYFTIASVTNNTDSLIQFWIMTCSWPEINWVKSNKEISFSGIGCDANFPTKVSLLPKQSINFYGAIRFDIAKKSISNKTKLGFVYFQSERDLNSYFHGKLSKDSLKTFWSNEITIKDNLFGYEITKP